MAGDPRLGAFGFPATAGSHLAPTLTFPVGTDLSALGGVSIWVGGTGRSVEDTTGATELVGVCAANVATFDLTVPDYTSRLRLEVGGTMVGTGHLVVSTTGTASPVTDFTVSLDGAVAVAVSVPAIVVTGGGPGGGAVASVNGRTGVVTGLAEQSALTAEAALARNADNLTSGLVADARIAPTIARDSEVTAAVAAHEADTTAVHGIADTSALVLTGDSRLSDTRTPTDNTVATAKVQARAVTWAKVVAVATSRILGRTTAGSGDVEELTAAQAKAILAITNSDVSGLGGAAVLNVGTTTGTVAAGDDSRLTNSRTPSGSAGGGLTGTYPNPTLATGSVGSAQVTDGSLVGTDLSASAAVTLTQLANMATARLLGNNSGSSGPPLELTAAQVKTLLAIANTDVSGLGSLATKSAVASADITDGTIVDADISASAAIALSKLATQATLTLVGNSTGGSAVPTALTASQVKTLLGLVIGTDVQAYDAELAALAGLTSAADKVPYFTGSGTAALATVTSAARTVLDDTTVGAMLTTLGAVDKANGGVETVNTQSTATGATTLNLSNGNVFDLILTGNVTFTFSGSAASTACSFTLIAAQDGSGSKTITWPASVKWEGGSAPTISTAASRVDLFSFLTVDNGTTWRCIGYAIGVR